jgi:hypothetical protein
VRTPVWFIALALGAGCGGDDEESLRPLVEQIAPAVAAVEAERGGPQQYFEVNATPQLVNVFVADGEQVVPYVYVGGELGPPAAAAPAEGEAFTADALTFDPLTILDGIAADLPDSDIVLFTVVGGPDGAMQYGAGVQSDEGGTLDVVLTADGAVESVTPGG